jgi:hypothetical protein
MFYGTINGGKEITSSSEVTPISASRTDYYIPTGWGDTCRNDIKSDNKPVSVDECAKLCDENSTCKAFEYGTGKGLYNKGECHL